MKPDTILILEDNADRIAAFRSAVAALGGELDLRLWHDAPTMLAEAGQWLDQAILISLDHDLNPMPGATGDPGTGLEVAAWIAQQTPRCPVILHSSNAERVQSMVNEMRFGGWTWERVAPWGDEWIGKTWQARARALIDAHRALRDSKGTASSRGKPADHAERMNRAQLAFDGLSVGDAFGECFFCSEAIFKTASRSATRHRPRGLSQTIPSWPSRCWRRWNSLAMWSGSRSQRLLPRVTRWIPAGVMAAPRIASCSRFGMAHPGLMRRRALSMAWVQWAMAEQCAWLRWARISLVTSLGW